MTGFQYSTRAPSMMFMGEERKAQVAEERDIELEDYLASLVATDEALAAVDDALDTRLTTAEADIDALESILVQSGIETQTADANGAFTAITFPIPFSSTPAVTLTVVNTSISQQDTCNIFSVSSTQVRWRVMRNNGNIGATSATVHWIAVGPA